MNTEGDGSPHLHMPFSQYSGTEQSDRSRTRPAHRQPSEQWGSQFLDTQMSFSSPDWPLSSETSNLSNRDVIGSSQSTRGAPGTLLDLRPYAISPADAGTFDLQSLVKPVDQGWQPPLLPRASNVAYGYQPQVYARSVGVRTEPFHGDDAASAVGSDLALTFDSPFFSWPDASQYKRESTRDDRSEYSAVSGALPSPEATRPRAGRFASDSQVAPSSGRRRRLSQPLPICKSCNAYQPKNHSDELKHERKHTKPFKCRHAECKAKDIGFSTKNDLDRHYTSGKHQEAPTKGALKGGFVCIACTDGKNKWWPRQDNFKAHCSRRHAEWNRDDLMKQSVRAVRPMGTLTEDNTTLLSDQGYQLQFSQQHAYVGAYDDTPLKQDPALLTQMAFTDTTNSPHISPWNMQQNWRRSLPAYPLLRAGSDVGANNSHD